MLRRALSGAGVCGAAAVALFAGGDDARRQLPACDARSDLRQMARQLDDLEQTLWRVERAQRRLIIVQF